MSIYKSGGYGELVDPSALSPRQFAMAATHATSITLSRLSLGIDTHVFSDCPTCIENGASFRAFVAQKTEGENHAS